MSILAVKALFKVLTCGHRLSIWVAAIRTNFTPSSLLEMEQARLATWKNRKREKHNMRQILFTWMSVAQTTICPMWLLKDFSAGNFRNNYPKHIQRQSMTFKVVVVKVNFFKHAMLQPTKQLCMWNALFFGSAQAWMKRVPFNACLKKKKTHLYEHWNHFYLVPVLFSPHNRVTLASYILERVLLTTVRCQQPETDTKKK